MCFIEILKTSLIIMSVSANRFDPRAKIIRDMASWLVQGFKNYRRKDNKVAAKQEKKQSSNLENTRNQNHCRRANESNTDWLPKRVRGWIKRTRAD